MRYNKIIIIGTGSLLVRCMRHVASSSNSKIVCVETENNHFSNLRKVCNELKVDYKLIDNKKELNEFFTTVDESSLVLSIHNSYIFKNGALENPNLKIINFHNSLLPKHPGRNAPSWAIYDLDKVAGITWHKVACGIDKGDIIKQKSVSISDTVTAFELTRKCVQIGFEVFNEIMPLLINDSYTSCPQVEDAAVKMHYSYEVPNDGIFSADWTFEKMSAFLRSMDFGIYPIFSKPQIYYDGFWYLIEAYKIKPLTSNDLKEYSATNESLLFYSDHQQLKIKIKPVIK